MNDWVAPKPEVAWDQIILSAKSKSPNSRDINEIHNKSRSPQKRSTQIKNVSRGKVQLPVARNIRTTDSTQLALPDNSFRSSPVFFPTEVINNIRPSTPVNTMVRKYIVHSALSHWLILCAGSKERRNKKICKPRQQSSPGNCQLTSRL